VSDRRDPDASEDFFLFPPPPFSFFEPNRSVIFAAFWNASFRAYSSCFFFRIQIDTLVSFSFLPFFPRKEKAPHATTLPFFRSFSPPPLKKRKDFLLFPPLFPFLAGRRTGGSFFLFPMPPLLANQGCRRIPFLFYANDALCLFLNAVPPFAYLAGQEFSGHSPLFPALDKLSSGIARPLFFFPWSFPPLADISCLFPLF